MLSSREPDPDEVTQSPPSWGWFRRRPWFFSARREGNHNSPCHQPNDPASPARRRFPLSLAPKKRCGARVEERLLCGPLHPPLPGKQEMPEKTWQRFARGWVPPRTKRSLWQRKLRRGGGGVLSLAKYLSLAKPHLSPCVLSCKISLDDKSARNKKAPRDARGACGFALSREERGPLRHGRVAWLTADSADHSGGTAADSHGLPRFPCLPIEKSV
jgi:hypothetical protein